MNINELSEKLSQNGMSLASVEERFMGNLEFYVKCLDEFSKEQSYKKLATLLTDKDYNNALIVIYELNGVALNLGLSDITKHLSQLDNFICSKNYNMIDDEYKKLAISFSDFKTMMSTFNI